MKGIRHRAKRSAQIARLIDYYNLFDDKLTATNYKEPISLSGNITTWPSLRARTKATSCRSLCCSAQEPLDWAWALLEYAILVVWYTEDVLTGRPFSFLRRLPPLHPTLSSVAYARSTALAVPEYTLWHNNSPFCQTVITLQALALQPWPSIRTRHPASLGADVQGTQC